MLRKQVIVKFYVMNLWMTNVEWLIQGNPQGALSRISSMGCYSHIPLCINKKSNWIRVLTSSP